MSDHGTDTDTEAEANASDGRPDIAGMRTQEAMSVLLEHDPSLDGETVYGALYTVASYDPDAEGEHDARVTWEAVEEKLKHLSKVVSTPETRVELAEMELEEALEAAGGERHREVVQHRLDGFAARLDAVQREVSKLGGRLRELTAEDEDLYAVARGIVTLEHRANDLQGRADDLQLDLEEFRIWVSNPPTRFDELDGDLNALGESVEGLTAGVDRVDRALGGDPEAVEADDPELAWVDTTLTQRVLDLLCSDLRWEFEALREWSDEAGHDVGDRVDRLDGHIGTLAGRVETAGERLAALGCDGLADRYTEERADFEADLDLSPPVDWGRVQATLGEHRRALTDQNPDRERTESD